MSLLDFPSFASKIGIALLWCAALQPAIINILARAYRKNLPFSLFFGKLALNKFAFTNRSIAIVLATAPLILLVADFYDLILAFPLYLVLMQLTVLDMRYFWLPDRLTILLILSGLLISASDLEVFYSALLGGLVGFLLFQVPRWIFNHLKRQETLGMGDIKLAVAMGIWLGLEKLPITISIACLTAALSFVLFMRKDDANGEQRIALGVFLSLAFWWVWSLNLAGKL